MEASQLMNQVQYAMALISHPKTYLQESLSILASSAIFIITNINQAVNLSTPIIPIIMLFFVIHSFTTLEAPMLARLQASVCSLLGPIHVPYTQVNYVPYTQVNYVPYTQQGTHNSIALTTWLMLLLVLVLISVYHHYYIVYVPYTR